MKKINSVLQPFSQVLHFLAQVTKSVFTCVPGGSQHLNQNKTSTQTPKRCSGFYAALELFLKWIWRGKTIATNSGNF